MRPRYSVRYGSARSAGNVSPIGTSRTPADDTISSTISPVSRRRFGRYSTNRSGYSRDRSGSYSAREDPYRISGTHVFRAAYSQVALDGHVVLAGRLEHPRFRQVQTISHRNHAHTFRLISTRDINADFRLARRSIFCWRAAAPPKKVRLVFSTRLTSLNAPLRSTRRIGCCDPER